MKLQEFKDQAGYLRVASALNELAEKRVAGVYYSANFRIHSNGTVLGDFYREGHKHFDWESLEEMALALSCVLKDREGGYDQR